LDLIKGLSLLMSLATLFTVVGYATEPLGSPSSSLDCREQGAFQIVGVMQGGQVVQQHVQGVMAAPNRARIQARVLRAEQSTQDPEKWQLELEILASQTVSGPNFARVGEKVQGFTFGPAWEVPAQTIIEAEAEYIGGPHAGQFQLTNVRITGQ
jgi:hypothetical protein